MGAARLNASAGRDARRWRPAARVSSARGRRARLHRPLSPLIIVVDKSARGLPCAALAVSLLLLRVYELRSTGPHILRWRALDPVEAVCFPAKDDGSGNDRGRRVEKLHR